MGFEPPPLRTVTCDNVDIPYLAYDGDGPPVVLLHATGFLPWLWHPVAALLTPAHRVIAPFFGNHRRSDPRNGGLDWLQLARDLVRLCTALQVQDPILVGHSMGGTVSTLAHVRLGLPVRRMVLIEPIFLPAEIYRADIMVEQHPLAAKAMRRRNSWPDREAVRADFMAKPFFRNWDPAVFELYLTFGICNDPAGGVRLTCPPEQEAALFMGGGHHDPWPMLPAVACPTLVMEGEDSENRPWIDLPHAASLIPRGRHILVPGAGHLIPMERPGEVGRALAGPV